MITVKSTDNLKALEAQWADAKDAKDGWAAHQLLLEGRVLELIPRETFVDVLPSKGKIRMDKTDVTFGTTRSWDQTKLAALIADFPWLLTSLFKIEYKCVSNPALDKFIASNDDEGVGQRLRECFEEKDRKPGFAKR